MLERSARFATTRWSIVLRAQGDGSRSSDAADAADEVDSPEAALASLCQAYWPAVYAFLRRRGHDRDAARDLAQGFFTKLIEKDWVDRAEEERGSFRAFLVTALRRYVAGEYEREGALRRGGGDRHVALEFDEEATWEPADDMTPEKAFDAAWVQSLLSTVLERLAAEYKGSGQSARFVALEPYLVPGDRPPPFRELAAALGMAESSCRVAVFRARGRYRELLRSEVASTLGGMDGVDAELDALISG